MDEYIQKWKQLFTKKLKMFLMYLINQTFGLSKTVVRTAASFWQQYYDLAEMFFPAIFNDLS